MMSRREFLLGATAVGTVAAVGGVVSVAAGKDAQEADAAQRAWKEASGIDRILLAATFAANSHNTQPWRFRVGDGVIDVLADSGRGMGAADPRSRELFMSLGCAVENAVIAAADLGTPVDVEYASGGDGLPFARLRFADRQADARDHADLASAIATRRTNRAPYDTERQVPSAALESLSALASAGVGATWLTAQGERERFGQLSFDATRDYVADKTIQRDSHRWYRLRGDDAERTREGITVRGANLPPIGSLVLGLFPPTPDDFDKEWAKTTRGVAVRHRLGGRAAHRRRLGRPHGLDRGRPHVPAHAAGRGGRGRRLPADLAGPDAAGPRDGRGRRGQVRGGTGRSGRCGRGRARVPRRLSDPRAGRQPASRARGRARVAGVDPSA